MKYIRRLLWFVATRLAAISVIVGLLVLVFYLAMNTANIYLLLSDETLEIGLSDQSPYVDYNIDSYNYEMAMEWMWAWPWENTATATIVERVPRIVGSVRTSSKALVKSGAITANPPYQAATR